MGEHEFVDDRLQLLEVLADRPGNFPIGGQRQVLPHDDALQHPGPELCHMAVCDGDGDYARIDQLENMDVPSVEPFKPGADEYAGLGDAAPPLLEVRQCSRRSPCDVQAAADVRGRSCPEAE